MPVTDTGPAADSPEIATELLEGDEPLAIDQFIAQVLRRAHETALEVHAHSEARAILHVAHLFADDLEHTDLPFDRLRFIEAAIEEPA